MRIQKTRVRKLDGNLIGVERGSAVVAAFPISEISPARLARIGFTQDVPAGQTVLPSGIGPVSQYNAEGRVIVHRDLPMETKYRQIEWTYTQWHGRDRVEVTEYADVPYRRYPRTFVPPAGIELSIAVRDNGEKLVVAPPVAYEPACEDTLALSINLMLELFHGCDILDGNLASLIPVPVVRVNWRILPEGRMPWNVLKPHLQRIIDRERPGNRPVIAHRLKLVNSYQPQFTVVGEGGFSGYVIFAFPERNLYVLECIRYGNATYIFDRDWESLSRMTKAEILDNAFQKDRLIHVDCWDRRLATIMGQSQMALGGDQAS